MIVSGFMPMKSEINPLPLMRKLADAGAQLALPVIAGRGKPLIMRAWKFGDPFKAGQWGIREPMPEAPRSRARHPDRAARLLRPRRPPHRLRRRLLRHDHQRAAREEAVVAIGIAFAAQEIPQVPATERDARLDLVLTEREVIDFAEVVG